MPVTLKELNAATARKTENLTIAEIAYNRKLSTQPRYIYFVRSESGHIKIGSANNVKRRMIIMRTDCPFKIKLLGKIKIGEFTEGHIQRMFKEYHYRGEWFIEAQVIIDFIGLNKIGRRR